MEAFARWGGGEEESTGGRTVEKRERERVPLRKGATASCLQPVKRTRSRGLVGWWAAGEAHATTPPPCASCDYTDHIELRKLPSCVCLANIFSFLLATIAFLPLPLGPAAMFTGLSSQ